ncbi:MAG: GAF domain-containing protein, partial [Oceanospirillales bacterium]
MADVDSDLLSSEQPSMNGLNSHTSRIKRLNQIGIALSAEHDKTSLLEIILTSARELTQADAGTLYMIDSSTQEVHFPLVQNHSLNIFLGGKGQPSADLFKPIPLFDTQGTANKELVVTCAIHDKKTICIADVYNASEYDFSGTKSFDAKSGYRSRSFLTVPLI